MAWKYRVVKKQRGLQGEWFSYPGRAFSTLEDATEYATTFAADQTQAGVVGTRIVVIGRSRATILDIVVNR